MLRVVQVLGRQWKYSCRVQCPEGLATGAGCGRVLTAPATASAAAGSTGADRRQNLTCEVCIAAAAL